MRVGTRSLLFGVHCWFIHPWFVAAGWWRLYGFPWDPHLWVAFFVHDWGYWGKPNMDGPEGESHPLLGASIMGWLFDRKYAPANGHLFGQSWRNFTLYHSRFYAKKAGVLPSRLCFADKLTFHLTPRWLYLLSSRLSGELTEYRRGQAGRTAAIEAESDHDWWNRVDAYITAWIREHVDGREDGWTEFHGLTARDEELARATVDRP